MDTGDFHHDKMGEILHIYIFNKNIFKILINISYKNVPRKLNFYRIVKYLFVVIVIHFILKIDEIVYVFMYIGPNRHLAYWHNNILV